MVVHHEYKCLSFRQRSRRCFTVLNSSSSKDQWVQQCARQATSDRPPLRLLYSSVARLDAIQVTYHTPKLISDACQQYVLQFTHWFLLDITTEIASPNSTMCCLLFDSNLQDLHLFLGCKDSIHAMTKKLNPFTRPRDVHGAQGFCEVSFLFIFFWAHRATCNKCVGRNLVTSTANTGLPWPTKSTADCGQQWDLTAFTAVQWQPKVVSLISFVTWVNQINQYIVLVGTTRESCLASTQRLTSNHTNSLRLNLSSEIENNLIWFICTLRGADRNVVKCDEVRVSTRPTRAQPSNSHGEYDDIDHMPIYVVILS